MLSRMEVFSKLIPSALCITTTPLIRVKNLVAVEEAHVKEIPNVLELHKALDQMHKTVAK